MDTDENLVSTAIMVSAPDPRPLVPIQRIPESLPRDIRGRRFSCHHVGLDHDWFLQLPALDRKPKTFLDQDLERDLVPQSGLSRALQKVMRNIYGCLHAHNNIMIEVPLSPR